MSTTSWQVPTYTTHELSVKKSDYCVCVFVINEGEKIREQLQKMRWLSSIVDIIIADGGSSDNSLDLDFLVSVGVRTLLIKIGAGQLSAQMRMAFSYCLEQGYLGIITIDGNNKDDSSAIPRFIQALTKGYDHLQGSRFISGGVANNTPLSRLLAVRLIHAPLISLSSGYRYTDTTNGFRAYSRKFLLDERVAPFRDIFRKYELHYYLAIRAPRLGFRVKEIPVTRSYPKHGKIPTKISPLLGNSLILFTLIKACLGRFNPSKALKDQ